MILCIINADLLYSFKSFFHFHPFDISTQDCFHADVYLFYISLPVFSVLLAVSVFKLHSLWSWSVQICFVSVHFFSAVRLY